MNVDFNPAVFFTQWWWVGFDLQFGHTTRGLHFKFIRDRFVFLESIYSAQKKKNLNSMV